MDFPLCFDLNGHTTLRNAYGMPDDFLELMTCLYAELKEAAQGIQALFTLGQAFLGKLNFE